ncbi:excinuclease ABC subunit UvrC [Paraneptunicella aestuarii]|uniref:excinuclease ABC subunit UvrC n=1 Tax=Paraneptunicella aestuarii TaxID=2831148 RepID=UPI001E5291D3|nr:excinuclease ABC subunit UvrC [Paraneptunicella aestuarii]UAA37290.1 excinuclease ABC subunit UvrC [Paraneptunicella aestuarii]
MVQSAFDHKAFLKSLTQQPGVYRMYNQKQEVIYVGKAKNLKKRVSSYFKSNLDSPKTISLVRQIADMDVTVTHSETEAYILENNYIKKYKPRYNVLLRDDKSYPFIFLSGHQHPRLAIHRGSRRESGEYFGPYPSAWAVRESLRLMQKIFPVRQCEDAYYKARTRPCLQHQLKRCSAPCVEGFVSDDEYQQQVNLARMFLKGKSHQVIDTMVGLMEESSRDLEFEKAARYRDQIAALRKVQEQQWVSGDQDELDVFGFAYRNGIACIQAFFIRDNKLLGSKSYFPKVPSSDEDEKDVFHSFLLQFYLAGNKSIPKQIVLPMKLDDAEEISNLLGKEADHKIQFFYGARDEKKRYLQLANTNAENALEAKQAHQKSVRARFLELESILELQQPLQRMECFDISHTSGQQTVASCVVFNREGPLKTDYRRYNIEGITPGDDYAAMAQVLKRRYKITAAEEKIPDIVFIDGGKGQLAQAEAFFDQWQGARTPLLIGIAKGTSRKPGLETLIMAGSHDTIPMPANSAALHLVQHIRDESHRFAIAGHRHKRQKVKTQSKLESIPGVGAKRRQSLLKYLGGMQEVLNASSEQLANVPGISPELASLIYDHLHN